MHNFHIVSTGFSPSSVKDGMAVVTHATSSTCRAHANTDVINNPHFTDIKEDLWIISLQYNRFFAEIDPGFVISTNIQTDKLAKVSKTLGISTFQHKMFLTKA